MAFILPTKSFFFWSITFALVLGACSESKPISDSVTDTRPTLSDEEEDYISQSAIRFEDRTYVDDILSVQLYPANEPLEYPIINLNGPQPLELHFDDLGSEMDQYYYRIYHCTAEWERSDIIEIQYMEGFFSDLVDDFDLSFNTMVPFVHYRVQIPNESMRITASGNYLLVVTLGDDESQPILTRRFMVVDPRVNIEATVKQSLRTEEERRYQQLVDFNVHHPAFDINNPFRDIKAVVLQNWRWDRAITELKPIFLRDRMLEYRYDSGNGFWAGNEFRQFNISSTRYITEEVTSVQREGDRFVATLNRDYKRSLKGYRTFQDINGQFLIRNTEGFNDFTEADYVDVHFLLDWPSPAENGSFYVYGALSDWRIDPRFKLRYDYDLKGYTCTAQLKQGFYEYHYVFLADKSDQIDELPVEGSYFETENDYSVLIYFRNIGLDYDELIGFTSFTTRNRF